MQRSRQRQNLAHKEGNTFFVKARCLRRNFLETSAILFFTAIASAVHKKDQLQVRIESQCLRKRKIFLKQKNLPEL